MSRASQNLVISLVVQLFQELLGYDTVNVTTSNEFYKTCGLDLVDVAFEGWPLSSASYFQEWVLKRGDCLSFGSIGYTGYNFIGVPEYVLERHPEANLDVGNLYKTAAANQLFVRSGTTPQHLHADYAREFVPEWCALVTNPPNCHHQLNKLPYFNFECNVTQYSPHCMELLDITWEWQTNVKPSIVRNLKLNVTIPYLGWDNYHTVMAQRLAAKDIIFTCISLPYQKT